MNAVTAIPKCVNALFLDERVYRATVYISEKWTVKITRKHKLDRRDPQEMWIVTFGQPNYVERAFIKKCKVAGEPFPVRKVQLKFYPATRRKAA